MRKHKPLRLAAIVAAAALFAAACGGADESDAAPDQPANQASDEASDESSRLDQSVFQGEAETVAGGTVDLADFADQDLVLWFWAPW